MSAQRESLEHLGTFTAFTMRRNWVRFGVWMIIIVGMLWFIIDYYKQLFTDESQLQGFVDTVHSPSLLALVGIISNPVSIGGAVWCKYWMFASLMLGIGVMFLMTRNLRGDEDEGRAELVRSYPLGIHVRLMSSVLCMTGLCVVIGVLSGLVTSLTSVTDAADATQGSWIVGASIGAMGLLGVGIGALASELCPSSSAANGAGLVVFAVFYIVRMVGDLQSNWLVWASPIGWGQKMDPWGANRWWLLVPIVGLTLVLIVAAWISGSQRDLGASLARQSHGEAHASGLIKKVWGMGLRLQRGSMIGWGFGMVVFSLLLGSILTNVSDLFSTMDIASVGEGADLDTITGQVLVPLLSLAVGVFAAQSATAMRSDETRGVLESQIATSVSRVSWVLQRLAVTVVATAVLLVVSGLCLGASYGATASDMSKVGVLIGAFAAYLPACLILASIFVLGFGWWPRFAVPVTWIVVGALWAVMIVGVAMKIPQWLVDILPFSVTPQIPAEAMDWPPVIILALIAIALTVVGLVGFRRRNIPS